MSKVVLGFSGGVDSAVSAVLLKKMGFQIHGVYLDNADSAALDYARSSAEHMGIDLSVIDVKQELEEKVCIPFARCYMNGQTPNPCILCNPSLKFRNLIAEADRLGAELVSTGHYARSENGAIYKGMPSNDQSYMLCRLTREQAARLVLPLGRYEKSQIRELAADLNLPSARKPDSMEICFIPDKDYVGWLARRGITPPQGNFMFHGQPLGRHSGIQHYTVGQRRPGLFDGRKLYISGIDAKNNIVELALWEELFKTDVCARSFNWLIDEPSGSISASVRVRHTKWENPDCSAWVDGEYVHICCVEPVRAPAAGQSAVLYSGDRLLGGGFIVQE